MKHANLNFIDDLNLDQNVEDKLSILLMRTVSGNDDDYLTPMAKEHSPELLISELNKVFIANRSKLNLTLQALELQNKAAFGSRSRSTPWQVRKSSLSDSFSVGNTYNQMQDINPMQGKPLLRPLSRVAAAKLLKNDTSSGLPYFGKKGVLKDRVLDKFDSLLSRKDPCLLFTRTQELGKTRNVWGYPMVDTLNEMMYYAPLLDYQRKLDYRSAIISPIEVCRQVTDIILSSMTCGDEIVSIDFSRYDNSVKTKLQKLAFSYIKSLFQCEYHSEIDYIAERFNTIGIVTPDGVLKGSHGVPSGSTFTNEVDSIVQATIVNTLPWIRKKQIQGDDAVYQVPKDKVVKLFKTFESFGLTVNRDKSYTSSNYAVYLQNLFHIDYIKNGFIGGIYPIYRALNRLCFQERWSNFEDYEISGKDYYSIRTICIVENCKYHPLFRELVQFVLKYDKYSLDVSDQGIANYVQMIRRTKGAGEILNHQFGDDVKGIRNFETFKMVKELS